MALPKPAGTWTYDDLASLSDDGRRYEIIEGELYEMPAASLIHATILINLLKLLLPPVGVLHARIFTAPVDVFFQGADPVQPDIVVVLAEWQGVARIRGLEGAPHLVIEILSPSNRGHDLLTKRALYARAGVREYWIVDPVNQTIELLTLDRDAFHAAQLASADDTLVSPILNGAAFPLTEIFLGIEDIVE
jgi:Uma2 family endonuclease